jgi:hypothetical protein
MSSFGDMLSLNCLSISMWRCSESAQPPGNRFCLLALLLSGKLSEMHRYLGLIQSKSQMPNLIIVLLKKKICGDQKTFIGIPCIYKYFFHAILYLF